MTHTENHLHRLEEEHARIDKRIDGMESTGVFDDVTLEVLKKQRLQLKTELVTLIQDYREPPYKTSK